MAQRIFQQSYYIGGTWAANHIQLFKLPCDAQLIHVSAVNTSANAGKIDIGSSADDDAYLDNQDFGVSSTPVEYDRDNFVGGQFPHIAGGTIIKLTLTDHASHMAQGTVVLTFTEG